MLQNSTPIVRNPNCTTRKIGQYNVVLDFDHSTIIKLNETASLVWELFTKETTIEEITTFICKGYDVENEAAFQDVAEFITESKLFISPEEIPLKKKRINANIYEQLEEVGFENIIPVMVEIELTDRCNLSCVHCNVIRTKHSVLKTSEFCSIIDQLESIGCFELTFTGGEIFTRKDTIDIIDYANRKGFAINLLTSATLLSIDEIQMLSKCSGLNNVQVSIYSAVPDVHDSITRKQGSFEKSMKNIELLLSNNVHVTLACVVMKINYSTYRSVETLAKDLGADFTVAYPIRARDNGSQDTFCLRLSYEEIYNLFAENRLKFCIKNEKKLLEDPLCHAGRVICSISAKGDVFPCILFPLKAGNLRDTTFKEIWNRSPQLTHFRNLKLEDTYQCKSCRLTEYCPICPGLSLLEEKDMLAPAKINCLMADAIYKIQQEGGDKYEEKIRKAFRGEAC